MKVYLDSIGCRVNQSEIEKIGAQFRAAGHELVADASDADLVVINTCAVTAAASADSRKKIRAAAKAGKARIVATGCYATIDPHAVEKLPSVTWIFTNEEKNQIASDILGEKIKRSIGIQPRVPLPGSHKRTRAFIKVQDGCDNFCTFCITRIARGSSRSTSRSEIYKDVESALKGGVKEIVLTGVNLGSWGRDFAGSESLAGLIKKILEKFHPPRLRLSSLEPWDITDELLELLEYPNFCQHFHLPLQSGSDEVLTKMGRKISSKDFLEIITRIKAIAPYFAVTTDILVGFPGETDGMFRDSLNFIRNADFAGAHIFTYSNRPGTPAEKFSGRVHSLIARERSELVRAVINESAIRYRSLFLGKTLRVLWENADRWKGLWQLSGLSDNYLRIKSTSPENLYNHISLIKTTSLDSGGMLAEIIDQLV